MFNNSQVPSEMEALYEPPARPVGLERMETAVAIAIGALAAVFLGALVVLVVVWRRHHTRYLDKLSAGKGEKLRDVDLLITDGGGSGSIGEVELGEVVLSPDAERILGEAAAGVGAGAGDLAAHGLAVLKACHALTERLTRLAAEQGRVGTSASKKGAGSVVAAHDIVEVARRISPRVDDVVRAVYPPIDARLLEARAAALALVVTHLALLVTAGGGAGVPGRRKRKAAAGGGVATGGTATPSWLAQALADIDLHLLVLREAALSQEAAVRIQSVMGTGPPAPPSTTPL
ncbi:transmembrane protein 98-like isoform X1 [Schistocerca cancellata]|uniref:transmembrane protein 98-like isoform X1 n=2 Tax=Schistocerca cancellata TaxID=274614 RepID=UPI002117A525|nr:transmembrane protein 98-like isoform X1 [Schistocerca cancellata]XP_049769678.1 transmembrane protein 98-like isoform X1 [Schistocerca cancellata]XP_049769679.1 transmembrane protein 98-like isoform X1 [Schistocerca cancellata]